MLEGSRGVIGLTFGGTSRFRLELLSVSLPRVEGSGTQTTLGAGCKGTPPTRVGVNFQRSGNIALSMLTYGPARSESVDAFGEATVRVILSLYPYKLREHKI